MAETDQCQR